MVAYKIQISDTDLVRRRWNTTLGVSVCIMILTIILARIGFAFTLVDVLFAVISRVTLLAFAVTLETGELLVGYITVGSNNVLSVRRNSQYSIEAHGSWTLDRSFQI